MANLRFTPSVHHESQAIVPVSNYPGLLVPPGVPVHEPIAISFARMSQLAPDKFPAPAGLTVATGELSMKLQGTWKPTGTAPVIWKWQGGDMQLDVTVVIFNNRSYSILNVELARVKASGAGPKGSCIPSPVIVPAGSVEITCAMQRSE